MFNQTGIFKVTAGNRAQILANVELQAAVGCVVSAAIVPTADANGLKIAKAGTPITINLMDLTGTPAVLADGTNAMNAMLLHDVDVTKGNNNGTALIFGFVNFNRIDTATQALVTTATGNAAASKMITITKQ